MNVDIRSSGLRLPRARIRELLRLVRAVFAQAAHSLARILILVQPAGGETRRRNACECVIEVQMADGRIERVHERQRHLGALLRRGLDRAWRAVAPRVMPPPQQRRTPQVLPVPIQVRQDPR